MTRHDILVHSIVLTQTPPRMAQYVLVWGVCVTALFIIDLHNLLFSFLDFFWRLW